MPLLTANRLAKSHGGHVCFRDVSLTLRRGVRVGLIGPNGCGKTTLLRVLAGEEECEGELVRRRGLKTARLEQTPLFPPGSTPRSLMAEALRPWRELENAVCALREELAVAEPAERDALLRRLERLEAGREAGGGGEEAERRAETLLGGVGLEPEQFDRDMELLSGGERCRAALARLLMSEPHLWLLDEPTNHLDLSGIAFLERFLAKSAAAVVVVSHDRRFLDRTAESIWELENGELRRYPGNYSHSRRIREERRLAEWRLLMRQREFMRRETAFIEKWRAGTRSRQAQSRMKRLAKLELVDEPQSQSRLAALNLVLSRRLGDLVLETDGLATGFPGKILLSGLELRVEPGEFLGVVGPNGSGKTTLFQTLIGRRPALAGSLRWGPTAQTGTLGQHDAFPDEERTPLQYLQDADLGADDQDRRDKLGAMLFSGEEAAKPIRALSGGEKKRLMLTRLLLEGHNVLLLDEPTNHLDIQSAEAVTLALLAYPGSVLAISHDRHFLDETADRVLWLENGEWRLSRGGFAEAEAGRDRLQREREESDRGRPKAVRPVAAAPSAPDGPEARGPFARWSVARLEKSIIANEERLALLQTAFADPAIIRDGGRARRLREEMNGIANEQAGLEAEYSRRG